MKLEGSCGRGCILSMSPRRHNLFVLILPLLRMTGLLAPLVRYHQWRMRVAGALMKRFGTESMMPVWCSSRFTRHQRVLVRLGFMVEREFALARRAIHGKAFFTLVKAKFPDGYWSCAASGRRVIVTAPVSQISEWEQFVSEYDLQTR